MRRAPSLVLCGALLAALAASLIAAPPAGADNERQRLAAAAGALEDSTAALRAAAASLSAVQSQLPAAQRDVARARGELAGAEALAQAATTAVRKAELLAAAGQRRVAEATDRVAKGRATIGLLARRSYQQGPLGDVVLILDSGSPQALIDRAQMLKVVFQGLDDGLIRLNGDRVALATTTAGLKADQAALEQTRRTAAQSEDRARAVAARAEAASARVAALYAQQRAAYATAASQRAADLQGYRDAQAASAALAARLKAAAEARRIAGTQKARQATGRMLWPADGPLTSGFGYRIHPIYGDLRLHAGIDIGAGYGADVWAAEDGVVVSAGPVSGYGTLVQISHGSQNGKDVTTGYAHMSALLVSVGQRVSRGQPVGRVGNEGNSTGPHLHFEVRLDGTPVDPLGYVSPP